MEFLTDWSEDISPLPLPLELQLTELISIEMASPINSNDKDLTVLDTLI
jgi:hypothetical protein